MKEIAALAHAVGAIAVCDGAQAAPTAWIHPKPQPSDILFLQYTSGSTAMPKGVMVSHANVLANLGHIDDAFGIGRGDTIVSWLPPHHDMGLIGNILYSIYTASRCVLLPPAAFFARPFRWLRALSNYRARFTVAPNFAYDLCVDKTDEAQKRSLDLSALDFALNGSEPVRADTLRRFAAAFAASGLRASACAPVYGLAEATLMVSSGSFTPPDKRVQGVDKAALERGTARVAANGLEVASVGPSLRGAHRVAIVDPDSSLQCVEGDVGEIWHGLGRSRLLGQDRREHPCVQCTSRRHERRGHLSSHR